MKSVKLVAIAGACSLLLLANAAFAEGTSPSKPIAAASVKKAHAVKADPKGPAHKRPMHHDSTLDYPQLG